MNELYARFLWMGLAFASLLFGCSPTASTRTVTPTKLILPATQTNASPSAASSPLSVPSPTTIPSTTPATPPIVYTEDAQGNEVISLNGETGEVMTRIPVGAGPHDITVCQEMGLLFTGNFNASSVSVIDIATHTVIRDLSAGSGAHGVALDPGCDRLYVTNAQEDTLSVFQVSDFSLLKEIAVGNFPEYVTVGPEGTWVLTTNLGGEGSITIVDERTLTPVKTDRLGTDPHGWALSPDGARLAIAQLGSNRVYVLDAQTLEVITSVQTGSTSEWAAFRSPKELWVTNIGADYVSVIDLLKGESIARVTVGASPHGIAFTRDSRWAFVSLMREDAVVKIDAQTRQVVDRFPIGGELHNLVVWEED